MKIIRILVYEGTSDFMEISLGTRNVAGQKCINDNTITEFYLQTPGPLQRDPPDIFNLQDKEPNSSTSAKT